MNRLRRPYATGILADVDQLDAGIFCTRLESRHAIRKEEGYSCHFLRNPVAGADEVHTRA